MKLLIAAALSGAIALSLSGCTFAKGLLVDVSVIDRDTGSTLSTVASDGKLFVAGSPGHRYAVRIANRTGARVMTVLSVDGVNAVTGETASPEQSGYVLDPYQSTDVDGWRKSTSEVAQFNFTALSNSYAAKTGRPGNVGVIGVAVFREKQPVWRERDDKISARESQPAMDSAAPAPPMAAASPSAAGAAAPSQKSAASSEALGSNEVARRAMAKQETLGTGHGPREASYVSYTNFERESSSPNQIVSIWYDSYPNLVARGVIPAPRPMASDPQPFPNSFVPDPAG